MMVDLKLGGEQAGRQVGSFMLSLFVKRLKLLIRMMPREAKKSPLRC